MSRRRDLDWDGCFNVRDLGGLRTVDRGTTRFRAVVRADDLTRLTRAGWSSLAAYGVRTIVDLRNERERQPDEAVRPGELTTLHVPLDDEADRDFWQHVRSNELDGSPLYYPLFLERKARQCAAAINAVARAPEGGVVVHCGAGRDRTGLVSVLLLSLAGVVVEDIVADYERSTARLAGLWPLLGIADQGEQIRRILDRRRTSARQLLSELVSGFDAASDLEVAGVAASDLEQLRRRLVS
ncbi:MAG: protein-tyrosine phosphatase [Frankiaceae bacterium]|jgi:protein tyrosine/serine phosphatase|nr:protein-tyrosine phosphatase [Frankiaceae bacterium]